MALLVSNGHHPLLAEFCRNAIAPLSRRIAELLRFEAQVVSAIRRISRARNLALACRKTEQVILAPDTAELGTRIFSRYGVDPDQFAAQFRLALDGSLGAQDRVREMARVLAPKLRSPGRKPSAASVAREHLESFGTLICGLPKYTYDPIAADFSDPITLALRNEFNQPSFDPRPGYRRGSRRNRSK